MVARSPKRCGSAIFGRSWPKNRQIREYRYSSSGYWMELATFEKTVLALEPMRRMVPTTKTRITANMTAYSAMSCPDSSDQNLLN